MPCKGRHSNPRPCHLTATLFERPSLSKASSQRLQHSMAASQRRHHSKASVHWLLPFEGSAMHRLPGKGHALQMLPRAKAAPCKGSPIRRPSLFKDCEIQKGGVIQRLCHSKAGPFKGRLSKSAFQRQPLTGRAIQRQCQSKPVPFEGSKNHSKATLFNCHSKATPPKGQSIQRRPPAIQRPKGCPIHRLC